MLISGQIKITKTLPTEKSERSVFYVVRVADLSSIIIYETTPIKRIVAEAEIIDVLELPPEELWNQTKNESGISKAFFDKYFDNRTVAYAYKLGKIRVYDTPKTLMDYGVKAAPQSFVYV